jgi:hypothetical protein
MAADLVVVDALGVAIAKIELYRKSVLGRCSSVLRLWLLAIDNATARVKNRKWGKPA